MSVVILRSMESTTQQPSSIVAAYPREATMARELFAKDCSHAYVTACLRVRFWMPQDRAAELATAVEEEQA